jgi:predicted phage tail protein
MVNVNVNFSLLGIFQLVCAAIFLVVGLTTMLSATARENLMVVYTYGLILVGIAIILASQAFAEHNQQELLELCKMRK